VKGLLFLSFSEKIAEKAVFGENSVFLQPEAYKGLATVERR